MKSLFTVLALAVAVSFSGGAYASETADAKQSKAKSKKVCKRVRVTGSRIRERVCRTQRDWDLLERESQETLDRQREAVNQNVTGGDG